MAKQATFTKKSMADRMREAQAAEEHADSYTSTTPIQQSGVVQPQSRKSKTQQIKERRPRQVSVHFTEHEKNYIDDITTWCKRNSDYKDASNEEFIHNLVLLGIKAFTKDNTIAPLIMKGDDNCEVISNL